MDVRVDPSGKHGVAAQIDRRRVGRRSPGDRCNFAVDDVDADIAQRSTASVECAIGENDHWLRRGRRRNWRNLRVQVHRRAEREKREHRAH